VSTTQNSNASLIVDRNVEAGRADKLAYIAADQTLTYDELRRHINQMVAAPRARRPARGTGPPRPR
jgi:acyl-coenzyme A synthetase/AMP-(fatty) acid ligase